ncbi:uncharacterized protein LOC143468875 isoform X2 [Clavelina lepadiformis]|uniref:uncharacterized protein LOC143468875 isoform X2 n=1 Tax=Clavelina lepadiformis TaxID=159417 RepID=UPI00404194E7
MEHRSNHLKRRKIPTHLEPIDSAILERLTSHKNLKGCSINSEHTCKRRSSKRHSNSNAESGSGIPHCCSNLRCKCDPGDLDDCLTDEERQKEQAIKYEDPYQWKDIKDMPKEMENGTSQGQSEDDESTIKSKGIDLTVVGVKIEDKGVKELKRLQESGSVANIRVAKDGLSFEVHNKSVHKQKYGEKQPCVQKDTSAASRCLASLRKSKQQTAEALDKKLKKAEERRKEKIAEKMAHYKTVVGKYTLRAKQMIDLDKKRHEIGIRKIQSQLEMATQRRDQLYAIGAEKCRLRNSRIARLLENRRNAIGFTLPNNHSYQVPADFDLNNETRIIFNPKSYVISPRKSKRSSVGSLQCTVSPSKSLSQMSRKKPTVEHFHVHLPPTAPASTAKTTSPSAAGDGLEPTFFTNL